MKILLLLTLGVYLDGNRIPIKVYKNSENCKMEILIDSVTLQRDTISLELIQNQ